MGLKDIIEAMADFFDQQQMDYGIIGAFALYSYGYIRATQDIDFITKAEYKDKIITHLESLGFETTFSSSAFSNHIHSVGPVRVDIMYIEGSTAEEIFKATEKRIILKDLSLPVVSPEHLIAMKLFAIQNNPDRKFKDLADIKEIVGHTEVNKETVLSYFKKYGMEPLYNEVVG